jgi:hypothetical protein
MDVRVFRDTEEVHEAEKDGHRGLHLDVHLIDESAQEAAEGAAEHLADRVDEAKGLRSDANCYRRTHYSASDHLRILHYALGTTLILVTAIVSGSILQATPDDPSKKLTLITGVLAIAAVVLTALQTTFKPAERGEQHRTTAAGLGDCRRELDGFIVIPPADLAKADEKLSTIRARISDLEQAGPGYMGWTYRRARKEVMREQERQNQGARGATAPVQSKRQAA